MPKRDEISVWPLLERAYKLRKDGARLVRELRQTAEQIAASAEKELNAGGTTKRSPTKRSSAAPGKR